MCWTKGEEMKKPFSFLAAMFLWVVAAAHVARLIFGVSLVVGTIVIPLWLSIVPALVLPALAVMLRKEANR